MSSKERRSDRGRREAADLRRAVGRELRESRMTLNLSLAAVGREVGISVSQLSRVERASRRASRSIESRRRAPSSG